MERQSKVLKTALAASALLVVAACGSSNNSSTAGSGGSTTSSPPGGGVEVQTHTGPLGTYLTDAAGRTLYMFGSDTSTTSTCTGQCLTYWPPLTTTTSAAGSGGATAAMIGTIPSGGSTKQVTYAGHPLYYFAQDTAPGDDAGQGSDAFGAKWWMLSPAGKPITRSAAAPTSAPYSNGGGY